MGLVTNYMITTLGPVTEYYAAKGSGFTIVDIPWSVSAALPFALPFAVFLIPAFAILSLLLVKFKVFKTLQVNIWDYGIPLVVSGFAYVMFDSLVIAVICAFANFIWGIWLGDLFAKKWSGALGMEGTTTSNTTHMSLAGPVCWLINKILDHVPGINKISITPKTIQEKLGIVGEPAVIGLIVGHVYGSDYGTESDNNLRNRDGNIRKYDVDSSSTENFSGRIRNDYSGGAKMGCKTYWERCRVLYRM